LLLLFSASASSEHRGSQRPCPRSRTPETRLDGKGDYLPHGVLDRLKALRGPAESYSDVILRLVEVEAQTR
jgi:hypothetical protein